MAWAGWDRSREIRHIEFCKAAFRISEYLAWRRFHPPNTFMYGTGEAGKVGSNNKAIRYLSELIIRHIGPGQLSEAFL